MNDQTIDTMRSITDHAVDPAKETLVITAMDAPGSGGANYCYEITGVDYSTNPDYYLLDDMEPTFLLFQNGPIPKVGVNGITNEALLAIVADRLRGFQSGPYACDDNKHALAATEQALQSLKKRTTDRMRRGVKDTYAT